MSKIDTSTARALSAEALVSELEAEVEILRVMLGAEQDSADEMANVLSAFGDGLMFDVDRLQAALDQHDALRKAAISSAHMPTDAAVARAEQAEARVAELEAEVERLMAEIAELDFLRHEGGSDSVAAMEAMLRGAVLPILRAYAEDLLRCVSVGNDPATITGADWRDIADVLDAVCEAERFVGRPDDEYGALLNAVLDARTWEDHR